MDIAQLAQRVNEALMIPALRPALTAVSSTFREYTGIWFHPCIWQTLGLLILSAGGYWLYVFMRGAKA